MNPLRHLLPHPMMLTEYTSIRKKAVHLKLTETPDHSSITYLSESIPKGTPILPLSNDSVLSSTGEFSLVSALRNQIN